MTGWRKAAAVLVAASVLFIGCKQKDEAPGQQPQAATGGDQKKEPAVVAAKVDEAPKTDEPATPRIDAGCNSDFKQAPQSNTTLTLACSPYTLNSDLNVDGWDLTIEPGVELRIMADRSIYVGYSKPGRITAKGTADKPIKFVSGHRKEPGAWKQILISAHGAGSEVSHAVIENAGEGDVAAIENASKDFRLENTKFVGVLEQSYAEKYEGRTAEFADNDLSAAGGDEISASMNFASAAVIKNNKFATGKVILLSNNVTADLSIPNAGVPYRVLNTVNVDAEEAGKTAMLTIAPGAIFQMGEGAEWEFGYSHSGGIKAVGTAEQPIVFTRFGEADKGSWKGLEFHHGAKPPQLVHVKIEYAGEKSGQALRYNGVKALGKLQNVTVSKCRGYGLYSFNETPEPFEVFSDNTFEDIEGATLFMETQHADKLGPNNKFPANGSIQLERNVTRDLTLTAQGAPYVVLQVITVEGVDDSRPATITLEPGATVKFGPDGRFSLGYSHPGGIKAVGALDKLITFTAATDESWKGIDVNTKGKVQVENAVFEKLTDSEPAIAIRRSASSASIKAVKFDGVKIPVRDCTGKAKVEGVKTSRKGC